MARSDTRSGTEIVGPAEVAERLGVKPQTVHQWRYRGLLPPPDWEAQNHVAWRWSTIRRWATRTGRM